MATLQYPPRAHLHLQSPSMASLASIKTTASSTSMSSTTSTSSRLKRSSLNVRRTLSNIFSRDRSQPGAGLHPVPSPLSITQTLQPSPTTTKSLPTKPMIPSPITVRPRPESPASTTSSASSVDSKLNSLSTSLTSLSTSLTNLSLTTTSKSPVPTKILLTTSQRSHFHHLFRRLRRLHSHHDHLSSQFASNVAGLLIEQEGILLRCDHLRAGQRGILRLKLKDLRESVGKAFMKKAILAQRAVEGVDTMGKILDGGRMVEMQSDQWDGKGKGKGKAVETEDGDRIELDYELVVDALKELREWMEAQGRMEEEVSVVVGRVCNGEKIPVKVADSVTLRRFECFVGGQVGFLKERGERILGTITELEKMAMEMGC